MSSQSRDLRLLTLNISGPSVGRAERLAGYLLDLDIDVGVLTETRTNDGTRLLLESLAECGYEIISPWPANSRERGVAVVSRLRGAERRTPTCEVELGHRLVVADLDSSCVSVVAAYVPSRDASAIKIDRKRTFLSQMLEAVEDESSADHLVLLGDLNVVGRSHTPKYSVFRDWEYAALDTLEAAGLVDAFTFLHPGVQAHSWIGRTGNGYRYDYAFVSESLVGAIQDCEYLHDPRELGLSDHAGLMLTMQRDAMRPRQGTRHRRTNEMVGSAS